MKFIDEAIIEVKSGKGGAGALSFRREKFVARGGPDGGDGGKGGSVILKASRNCHTLLDFKFKPLWAAENGKNGEGRNKNGKEGADLILKVPIGTQILDAETKDFISDLEQDDQEYIIAAGGRGGKGNAFFKSATNQTPQHAQPGEAGQQGKFLLNLKLMADVGIIGLPNAGKSTFISRVSAAKPKIADYPFTTITPNLGVVKSPTGNSFVVADIPGLIPEAHKGKGLGTQFLKHIERTKVLLHLIDPFARDEMGEEINPFEAYQLINKELEKFSKELSQRKQIIAISKVDSIKEDKKRQEIKEQFLEIDIEPYFLSSVSGEGLEEILFKLEEAL